MTEKLIRGKAVKGDRVYGSYTFPEQLPMSSLIADAEALFADGILAVAWKQDHGIWNDSEYSDFRMHDLMATKNPEVVENWIDNNFGEYGDVYYDDDQFYAGSYHCEKLEFDDFLSDEYEHTVIEHFGKNAVIVITPEDVYRFDYDYGY